MSGAGTKPDGRQMWARVKAKTEIEVIKTFPNGYGFIPPTHGATSRTRRYRVGYAFTAPRLVTSTDRLGRAMPRVARTGFATRIAENADLR